MKKKNNTSWLRTLSLNASATFVIACMVILTNMGCGKQEHVKNDRANISKKDVAKVSAGLPGGRSNFTVAIGRFQTSPGTAAWMRLINWTFNGNGTVTGTYNQWSSTSEFGKTALNSHTCKVDSTKPSGACSQYSPTGWIVGTSANPSWVWNGTYTYNASTGALSISWGTGAIWENWIVSDVPGKAISKLTFVSSSSNYAITHGLGYGSNAAWSSYKIITDIPRVNLNATYAACTYAGGSSYTVTNWTPISTLGFSDMTSVTGGNSLHMKLPTSEKSCNAGCYWPATGNTGNIYHLSALNTAATARKMAWNHHCACLPDPDQYPCYSQSIHPYAMMQIIDDAGGYQGMLGIHQQDQPGSLGFNYSINAMMMP